jgi:CHAT domain-containing protein
VLAACHSGVAETGTHSMAAAFLAAGASQVIATLRTIDDAAAARLTRELYASDITDLPRALARIQASGREEEWLKFAVFGRATCNATP